MVFGSPLGPWSIHKLRSFGSVMRLIFARVLSHSQDSTPLPKYVLCENRTSGLPQAQSAQPTESHSLSH